MDKQWIYNNNVLEKTYRTSFYAGPGLLKNGFSSHAVGNSQIFNRFLTNPRRPIYSKNSGL